MHSAVAKILQTSVSIYLVVWDVRRHTIRGLHSMSIKFDDCVQTASSRCQRLSSFTAMATVQDYLQNPAWFHRMEQIFEILDTNKNGFLTLEDAELAADKLEKEVKPAAHLMAAVRAKNKEFYAALGVVPGKQTTKDEFTKAAAALAIAERARKEKGEEMLLQKLNNATRAEYNDYDFKFWYTLDDVDAQGMYGDKFEKK